VAAQAGGLGLLGTGGFYQERVYFYDGDGTQFQQSQTIGAAGTGIELVLGDRDDRILGITRVFWQAETAERDPVANTSLSADVFDPEGALAEWRDETRHVGVFAVGLQAGIIGDPETAMLTINAMVGSGFMTTNQTEFVYGDLGVGGTVRLSRQIEAWGNVNGHLRFRKWARGGAYATAGVRYLFD